jgi:hypothetical protein
VGDVGQTDAMKLHFSSRNLHGYQGVHRHGTSFRASYHYGKNDRVFLGAFNSAVEAAISYAKFAKAVSTEAERRPNGSSFLSGLLHLYADCIEATGRSDIRPKCILVGTAVRSLTCRLAS